MFGAWLQANPLQEPKRLINEQTVDLSPLFHWWTHRDGSRPLTAWLHLSGRVVATNSLGWTLDAQVEPGTHPGRTSQSAAAGRELKIVLEHPPLQQLADFERLAAQRETLKTERAGLAAQASAAEGHVHDLSTQQKTNRRNAVRASGLAQQVNYWKQVDKEAKDKLKTVDKQLQELHTKLAAFPDADHYQVDCLALELGQKFNGMPVYDYGVVVK